MTRLFVRWPVESALGWREKYPVSYLYATPPSIDWLKEWLRSEVEGKETR